MKITDLKNPLKADHVNLFSVSDWISSIGFVAWMGIVLALGAKALVKADTIIPGNNTPNSYKNMTAAPAQGSSVEVL